ncbi:carboxymuconolactone decarboxylase family protein [Aggregatibacter actinomycetemcomitans]|uniref:carboxymuconolactone decarboxylase family protein n=1 Tax=Aggregatibacter actinomycetemcomitans TaxID=714 RepID=UPI001F1218AF|nr:carboxymuconolactone decarboxylase family protein [Aggregatibacter actinomycetemcomitans]
MELTQRQQALAAIGAFTATGNQAELKTTLNHALDEGLTVMEAKDAMVQLYAYTGFPRSLNALFTLVKTVKERQEKGLKTEQGRTATALPKGMNMLEVGTKTQTDLVGQAVDLSALSRHYVAVAQRFNRLKTLKSLLKFYSIGIFLLCHKSYPSTS